MKCIRNVSQIYGEVKFAQCKYVNFVGVREVNFWKVDFSEAITNSKYQQHTRFIL